MASRSILGQTFLAAVLTLAASAPTVAQDRASSGRRLPLSLDYVPRDSLVVVAARLHKLFSQPLFAPVQAALTKDEQLNRVVDLSEIDDVSQMVIAVLPKERNEVVHADSGVLVLHFADDIEPYMLAERWIARPKKTEFAEDIYYTGEHNRCVCFFPDSRTAVLSDTETHLHRAITAGRRGAAGADWAEAWATVSAYHAAAFLDVEAMRPALDLEFKRHAAEDEISPLWRKGQYIVCGAVSDEELKFDLTINCEDESSAQRVSGALTPGLREFSKMLLDRRKNAAESTARTNAILSRLIDLGSKLVASVSSDTTEDNSVHLEMHLGPDESRQIANLAPAVKFALMAPLREQAINNIRRIAIAMHVYQTEHGRFPPSVVMGPDGKTPHSWRVELLPYLGQGALYRKYRLNEPWNGPHNRSLLDEMPSVYHCPGGGDDNWTNASYFAPAGKQTLFDGKKGIRLGEITDGTSDTLLLIEAKRNVPWTMPEDIPIDFTKDLPEFGGHFDGEFVGVRADGSADFFSKSTDPKILKMLIRRNDGRPVPQS